MRALIIADIHGNLEALDAVLAAAGPVDSVWCLGDVVGYGPDPNACLDRLRAQPDLVCVPGNHDWAAIGRIGTEDFNPEARRATEWTAAQLSDEAKTYLGSLPLMVVREPFTITHGSPREPIWEYLTTAAGAAENFRYFSTPACLVGHTHVPALFYQDPEQRRVQARFMSDGEEIVVGPVRFIANPGGVGQPRDQDPRAAYAIYDADRHVLTWHRVSYPVEVTQAKMRRAGLPERLAVRLAYGW
ncbi:MAG TPA: metallophosphoesterase family protein [Chloroflexota bacterium]